MHTFGQDHFQRNRFYFLEPFERKEKDPSTGAETGDPKAIAHTAAVNPTVPDFRNLRQEDGTFPVRPPDFHAYVPVAMLAQTAAERVEGSVRLLLATPEKNTAGKEMSTLRYAIGKVGDLKTDPTKPKAWLIDYTVELLQPGETKTLAGLPDVMTMIPLGLKFQQDPRATFLGQPLDRGMYEANTIVPGNRKGIATRSDATTREEVSIPTVNTFTLLPPAPTDSVFHATGAYKGSNGHHMMFSETHFDVQYNDFQTGERAVTNLGRFSFMPQATVSKSLMPIVVANEAGGDLLPAMLIPAQIRSSANLEVIVPSYKNGKLERLITPARLRIQAGDGCRALKIPTQATEQTGPALMFLCAGKFVQVPLAY
jgi:hypothetical protein